MATRNIGEERPVSVPPHGVGGPDVGRHKATSASPPTDMLLLGLYAIPTPPAAALRDHYMQESGYGAGGRVLKGKAGKMAVVRQWSGEGWEVWQTSDC